VFIFFQRYTWILHIYDGIYLYIYSLHSILEWPLTQRGLSPCYPCYMTHYSMQRIYTCDYELPHEGLRLPSQPSCCIGLTSPLAEVFTSLALSGLTTMRTITWCDYLFQRSQWFSPLFNQMESMPLRTYTALITRSLYASSWGLYMHPLKSIKLSIGIHGIIHISKCDA